MELRGFGEIDLLPIRAVRREITEFIGETECGDGVREELGGTIKSLETPLTM